MKRYIDADRLIAHLKDEIEECDPKCGGRPDIAYGVTLGLKSAIAFAETLSADVVEVIRCKDCKHWQDTSDATDTEAHWGECRKPLGDYRYCETAENDFCSYGERRWQCEIG